MRRIWSKKVRFKLIRAGNDFVGQINLGADGGGAYTTAAQASAFVVPANALVGLFVASGSAEANAAATIESVTISVPKVPGLPPPTDGGSDAGDGGGDAER
jgi:hypothetical protein